MTNKIQTEGFSCDQQLTGDGVDGGHETLNNSKPVIDNLYRNFTSPQD